MRFKQSFFRIVFALLFSSSLLYGYRQNNYSLAWSGAKSSALGSIIATGTESFNFIYHNPALLESLNKPILLYELKTSLQFVGFRTDYSVQYDGIAAFGFAYPLFATKGLRYIGLSYHTIFDSLDRDNSRYYFEMKKIGVSSSYSFTPHHALGINVGAVLGIERLSASRLLVAAAPSIQLSYKQVLTSNIDFGWYFVSPHFLDWGKTGLNIKEWTPFITGAGARFKLPYNFKLYTEVNYQGWDFISYEENGKQKIIDKGSGFFDLFQDVFFAFGLHYKSEFQSVSVEERAKLNENLKFLRNQNKTLILDERIPFIQIEMLTILDKIKITVDKMKAAQYGNNSHEQFKKQLQVVQAKKRDITFSLKEIEKTESESEQYIFSNTKDLAAKKKNYQAQLQKLSEEETAILNKREKQLNSIDINQEQQQLNVLKERYQQLNSELTTRIKQENLLYKNAIQKKREKIALSINEKKLLMLREQKEINNKQIKDIQAKKRGTVSLLPIEGDYYLGFYSDLYYSPSSAIYTPQGNITVGFSFKPFNIEFLTFHLSVIDKSLLNLVGLYPQNSLLEYVQVSAELSF